ncbi:MAG: hypothetical protein BKP49_10090 [Treponema sp. CETP13]|nr:MAG: hypothetical protein BKP49_10090 [Treponema sp. CETP13]
MNKRKALFIIGFVAAIFALTGCPTEGETTEEGLTTAEKATVTAIDVSTIPASNATKDITEENYTTIMTSITEDEGMQFLLGLLESEDDADDSDGEYSSENSVEKFFPLMLSSNTTEEELEDIIEEFTQKATAFENDMLANGSGTLVYNPTIDSVETGIDGFTLSIPTSSINISSSLHDDDYLDMVGAVSFAGSSSINVANFIAGMADEELETPTSIVKDINTNIAFNANAFCSDAKNESEIEISVSYATSYGMSVCIEEDGYDSIGGKLLASLEFSYNGTIKPIETLIGLLDGYPTDSEIEDAINNLPLTISISIKAYDNDNNETYTIMDTNSLYDAYTLLYPETEE